ncbi:MAG: cache domain-containing protein [Candidatus Aminicenantes bacterium]|nr:cache domain-containing protein [Candidatus Aminicenantes bacterium]
MRHSSETMDLRRTALKFLDLPLRIKFVLSFLIVILFGGLVSLFFGTRLEHRTIIGLAQAKVRHDLASAWMVYNEKLSDIRDIVLLNAGRDSIQSALLAGDRETLLRIMDRVRKDFQLDILTITDRFGRVVLRASQPAVSGDDQSSDPLVSRALRRETVIATEIVPRSELLKEGSDLAERAYLQFIPTPKASPRPEGHEEDGMLLKGATPILDERGGVTGVLYGGILLNQNYEIVDRVKDIVYRGERYKGKEIGTVTIFQNDLRISTNVTDAAGRRAIGTRVSQEVFDAVLIRGVPWVDRAFVVNHWYITAYEPIKNITGQIIGMLYVGMLERPYIDLRDRVMLTFTGIAALCVVVLLVILFFITSSITNPLRRMVLGTNRIARGDLNHRVRIGFRDEIGQLAHSFNQMTENLKLANENLIQWGKTLEKRVEERTKELREMQDYLLQSEKLRSLGKIAAGVAHEINNPLTSILINTHLMLERLEKSHVFYENLSLIADETARCTQIVKGLLEFARQNPPQKTFTNINELIERTSQLLENQASFQNIRISKDLNAGLPPLKLDRNKIQQVFWNLLLNACEAMPEGGQIAISSSLSEDKKSIAVRFADSGVGIPKENITKLFDPFFTTKSSGTGLGLAVSYGIIEQHDGRIEVKSEVGRGTVFTLSFPVEAHPEDTTQRGGFHE